MIPVCLVTGFLGSGKTTLLERLVERWRGTRTAFLVNEFSPLDVDGARLDLPADVLTAVAGGSIFCKCKVTDFIGAMKNIRYRSEAGEAFAGVVIEASGIANPKVIRRMFEETKLDEHFELRTIVCLVDPGSFHKLLRTLPNVAAQVEAADLVLLNKTDLFGAEAVRETRHLIEMVRPGAPVVETVRCAAPFDPFAAHASRALEGDYAACADPNYVQTAAPIRAAVDWARLQDALEELRDVLYRAKGYVLVRDGALYADLSASGWRTEQAERAPARTGLALIARGDARDRIESLVKRIEGGEFAA